VASAQSERSTPRRGSKLSIVFDPPACNLALLLIKGFQFAPALFIAAVLGDVPNGAVSIWMMPVLVLDGIIAAGYTGLALLLRAFIRPEAGLQSVRDVSRFLGIIAIGVLAIACVASGALVLMRLASNLSSTFLHRNVGRAAHSALHSALRNPPASERSSASSSLSSPSTSAALNHFRPMRDALRMSCWSSNEAR
jgi:integral membrane sensor domain MASE1